MKNCFSVAELLYIRNIQVIQRFPLLTNCFLSKNKQRAFGTSSQDIFNDWLTSNCFKYKVGLRIKKVKKQLNSETRDCLYTADVLVDI